MKTTSRLLGLCLSLSMLFALPACSGGQSASSAPSETTPAPTESSAAEESHYPVTVTTYNQNGEEAEQTFTKCPERVVSISQANTEMLVSLGLSDLIVATAHRTSTPWPETAAEYESLNFLAMDDYPSKEVVLSLEPDLIVGWGSLFAEVLNILDQEFKVPLTQTGDRVFHQIGVDAAVIPVGGGAQDVYKRQFADSADLGRRRLVWNSSAGSSLWFAWMLLLYH